MSEPLFKIYDPRDKGEFLRTLDINHPTWVLTGAAHDERAVIAHNVPNATQFAKEQRGLARAVRTGNDAVDVLENFGFDPLRWRFLVYSDCDSEFTPAEAPGVLAAFYGAASRQQSIEEYGRNSEQHGFNHLLSESKLHPDSIPPEYRDKVSASLDDGP